MYMAVASCVRAGNLVKLRLCPSHLLLQCNNRLQHSSRMTTSKINVPFTGKLDRFNGITVDSSVEECTIEDFPAKLEESLMQWSASSRRGVWFNVALTEAAWIPVLAKNGFDFHHANKGSVTMYKWLPTGEVCNIPPYAHTMVGVGAVVVNDKSEILVVREKYYTHPHLKLPGGYVDPGENIVDAAIREVYEETRIHTTFDTLLTLRHAHNGMFKCSDIYMVVSLKPKSLDITACEREIAECKWMDIEEYRNHPHVHQLNRLFVDKYLEYQKKNVKIECDHGIHQLLNKPYTVYYAK